MTLLALWLSLVVAAIGALGIVYPAKLLAFAQFFDSTTGLWSAALFRIVFGATIYLSAPTSHAPQILAILGPVIVVAGVLTPFIGTQRLHRVFRWWEVQETLFTRIAAGVVMTFGLLLTIAVVT